MLSCLVLLFCNLYCDYFEQINKYENLKKMSKTFKNERDNVNASAVCSNSSISSVTQSITFCLKYLGFPVVIVKLKLYEGRK